MPKQGTTRKNVPNDGKGRPKGTTNKITTAVRDALAKAFTEIGGHKWLVKLARDEPRAFAQLLAKCLPHQVVGENDGPIRITQIKRVIVDPDSTRQTGE